MQVNANIKAISNISKAQEVAANNIANVNTNGFKASVAIQNGDKLIISSEARAASMNAAGEEMSTSDPAQDMVAMTINQTSLEANVKTIQVQNEMNNALLSLKGDQR